MSLPSQPILASSIRVVELENVPTELRLDSRGYSAGSFSLRPSTGEGEEWRGERRRRRRRAATFPRMVCVHTCINLISIASSFNGLSTASLCYLVPAFTLTVIHRRLAEGN